MSNNPVDNDSVSRLTDDLQDLFSRAQETGDVSLFCEGKLLKAHKLILGSRSAVFKTMFEVDMVESNTGEVTIKGAEFTILKKLIRFIYCAKLEEESTGDLMKLMEIANRYQVDSLVDDCGQLLSLALDLTNVLDFGPLGEACNCDLLMMNSAKLIARNIEHPFLENWKSKIAGSPSLMVNIIENLKGIAKMEELSRFEVVNFDDKMNIVSGSKYIIGLSVQCEADKILSGIGLYGGEEASSFTVGVKILSTYHDDPPTPEVILDEMKTLYHGGGAQPCRFYFDKDVTIYCSDFSYEIEVCFKSNLASFKGKSIELGDSSKFRFYKIQKRDHSGFRIAGISSSEDEGQIPSILFK